MTLGEYIRAARLQQAAVQLLDSPEKVTEMALAAGYATPAAFTKAFKAYFHVTPTQLRGFDRAVALLNVRHLDPVTKRKSRQMQVEIQTLPDQPVLYVRRYGAENNNFNRAAKEAYAALIQYIIDHDLRGQMGNCLAITPDEPGGVIPDAACRFDAAFLLKESATVQPAPDDDAQIQVIPGGRWAVLTHQGSHDTLWISWRAAYRDWLPTSGETLRDTAPYEVYLDDSRTTQPEQMRTLIYLPLQ